MVKVKIKSDLTGDRKRLVEISSPLLRRSNKLSNAFATAGFTGLKARQPDMGGVDEYTGTGKPVKVVQLIIKPRGSSGSDDPLDQRGTVGWKLTLDTEILEADWIRCLYHVNDFSDS